LAVVYDTRMMSSVQTWTRIFPVPRLNVTPLGSTVNAVLVGIGAAQVNALPALPL
jgi:hypothetical protein